MPRRPGGRGFLRRLPSTSSNNETHGSSAPSYKSAYLPVVNATQNGSVCTIDNCRTVRNAAEDANDDNDDDDSATPKTLRIFDLPTPMMPGIPPSLVLTNAVTGEMSVFFYMFLPAGIAAKEMNCTVHKTGQYCDLRWQWPHSLLNIERVLLTVARNLGFDDNFVTVLRDTQATTMTDQVWSSMRIPLPVQCNRKIADLEIGQRKKMSTSTTSCNDAEVGSSSSGKETLLTQFLYVRLIATHTSPGRIPAPPVVVVPPAFQIQAVPPVVMKEVVRHD